MRTFLISILIFMASALGTSAQTYFDFKVPFPAAPLVKNDTVSLLIVGDVMMHARQLEYDYTEFLEEMKPLLNKADFTIANMEFSLGGKPYSGYPAFSAPDGYANYVKECGVDVFLMANNHILDRGIKGLKRTLSVYDSLGIRFCGAARDSLSMEESFPLILRKDGLSIALLNFTYGTNAPASRGYPAVCMMDKDKIHHAIAKAKEKKADVIIALPHWGTEYQLTHSSEQAKWAGWLVEEGVDAIVGAHPHVVQDTTHISGVPIIYSTGNFISNMSARNTRLGMAVELRIIRKDGRAVLQEPVLHFTWCTLPGMLSKTYKTIPIKKWASRKDDWLTKSDYENMLATLKRVCESTSINY